MRKSKKIWARLLSWVLAAWLLVQNAAAYINVINSYTPPSPDFWSVSVYSITLSNTSDKESTNVNFRHVLPEWVLINWDGSIQSSCWTVTATNNWNSWIIQLTNWKIRWMLNGINWSCTITVNVIADRVWTFRTTFNVWDVTAVTNWVNETNRDASVATLVQSIKNMTIRIDPVEFSNMNKWEQKEIVVRLQNHNNKNLTNVTLDSIKIDPAFRVVPNSWSSTCGWNVNTGTADKVTVTGMNIAANQSCEVRFKLEANTNQDADDVFTKLVRVFGTLTATSVTSDQWSVIDHDVDSSTLQLYSGLTVAQQFNEGTSETWANISKAVWQNKDTDITFTFKNNDTTVKNWVRFSNNFSPATGNPWNITFKEVVENTCGWNVTGQWTRSISMDWLTVPAAKANVTWESSWECKVVARLTVTNVGSYHSNVADEYKYANSFRDWDKAGSLYYKYDTLVLTVNEPGELGITKKVVPMVERHKHGWIYAFWDEIKYVYTLTNLSNSQLTNINFEDYYSEKRGNGTTVHSEWEDFRIKEMTTTCNWTKSFDTSLQVFPATPYRLGAIGAKVTWSTLNPWQSCDVEVTLQTNVDQEPQDDGQVDRQLDFDRFDYNHRTNWRRITYTFNNQNKTLDGNIFATNYSSKYPLKVSEFYKTSDLAWATSYIDVIVNKRGEYEFRDFNHKVELHNWFTLASKDIEYLPNESTSIVWHCDLHSKNYTIEWNVWDNTFRLKNALIPANDMNEEVLKPVGITDARHVSLCKMRIKVKVPRIDTENKAYTGLTGMDAQNIDYGAKYVTWDQPVGVRVTTVDQANPRNTLNKYQLFRSNTNVFRSALVANKSFNPERIKGGEKSVMKISLQNDFGNSEDVINWSYTESFANTRIQLHPEANPQLTTVKGTCEWIKFNVAEDRSTISFTNLNIDKWSVCEVSFNVTGKLEGNVISPIRQWDFSSENGPYNTNNAEATIQIDPSIFVYEKFDVPQINVWEKTNLNVEIFNTKKDPAMETITRFENVLPKWLEATRQISSTCGWNVEITKNAEGLSVITLTNWNNLPAGWSCKIVTEVTGMPGNYLDTIAIGDVNTASNIPNYNATEAPLTVVGKVTTVYKDKKCENNEQCGIPEIAPRCEWTQPCDAKEIPPYRTPTVPPTCVPTNDWVVCTHYYDKPKIITTYKDKSCQDKGDTCEIPDLAPKCEEENICPVKDIPPYTTPKNPPVCVEKEGVQHCTYYYEPPVVTEYKDKKCENQATCDIPDLAPRCTDEAVCPVKDIPPYITPQNPPVCKEVPFNWNSKQKVCTYYYDKPPVITTYKDKKCEGKETCEIPEIAPRCENKETFCAVKEIPPYKTPNTPPVCKEVPYNGSTITKQTVCDYFYEKPPVITTYKDKECEGKTTCDIPDLAPECKEEWICKVKDIPPYETPTTPPVCVETPAATICTYYYEKPKGEVIVRFLEEGTNSILHTPVNLPKANYWTNYDVTTNGNNDVKTADDKVKQTHSFTRVDWNTNGQIWSKTHTVTYYYSPKGNPPVPNIPTEYKDEECKWKDKCEIPDLAPQCTTSTANAACDVVDVPWYVPPTTPVKEGNKWIYYYKKKEGNVIVKYVDKATGKTITEDYNLRWKVDSDYNVEDKKRSTINDYTYDSTENSDKQKGKIIDGNIIITHFYNKRVPSSGWGWYVPRPPVPTPPAPTPTPIEKITEYKDKTTWEDLLPQCKGTEPCPVKEIPGYKFVETKTEWNKTIHYYEKIKDWKVIVKFVDVETFNEIKIEVIKNGKVWDFYNTVEDATDDVPWYSLIWVADFDVDEVSWTFKEDDITVVYIYERIKIVPKIEKPKLPKTGADLSELGIEEGKLIAQNSLKENVVPLNAVVDTTDWKIKVELTAEEQSDKNKENYMNYALIAILVIAVIWGWFYFMNRRKSNEE